MEGVEKRTHIEAEPTPRAYLSFGAPGHDFEYVFTVHDETEERNLPAIAHGVQLALGADWSVRFRGSRLEITSANGAQLRDDEVVGGALKKVLGERFVLEETY